MENQLQAFVGILRAFRTEDMAGQSSDDPSSEVQKIKQEDPPDSIWKVCGEFMVVFPKYLLKVFLPGDWGMNSKSILI